LLFLLINCPLNSVSEDFDLGGAFLGSSEARKKLHTIVIATAVGVAEGLPEELRALQRHGQ
jgi:hypothetical protein